MTTTYLNTTASTSSMTVAASTALEKIVLQIVVKLFCFFHLYFLLFIDSTPTVDVITTTPSTFFTSKFSKKLLWVSSSLWFNLYFNGLKLHNIFYSEHCHHLPVNKWRIGFHVTNPSTRSPFLFFFLDIAESTTQTTTVSPTMVSKTMVISKNGRKLLNTQLGFWKRIIFLYTHKQTDSNWTVLKYFIIYQNYFWRILFGIMWFF